MNKFTHKLPILLVLSLIPAGAIHAQDKYNDSIYAIINHINYAKEWPRLKQKINENKATAYELFKAAALRNKPVDECISYLNKALTLSTKGSDLQAVILFERSFAYKMRADYAREKADLENLSVNYPNFKYPLMNLSFLFIQEKAYDQAISLCQRILKLDPSQVAAYNNLTYAYAESRQYKNAVTTGEKGLKMKAQPDITSALLNNTGYARAMLGDYKRGIAEIDSSIRTNPKNSFAYFNKGRIYIQTNQKEQACAAFLKSRELGGVNLTAEYLKKYCK